MNKLNFDDLPESTKKRLEFFHENYHFSINSFKNDKNVYLGSKENRICRFCKKDSNSTKFSKVAHAISELLGNKSLRTYYECDSCNKHFGDNFEDHLAKYTLFSRTMSRIKGKKKVPSYKKNDNTRIDFEDNIIKIKYPSDEPIAFTDSENKLLTIKVEKQPYRPRAVYKALVKIALTLLPEEEMKYFKDTIDWLLLTNEKDSIKTDCFLCVRTFTEIPVETINVILMKRKKDSLMLPYSQIFLAFSNYTFQIFIPFCSKDDHLIGKSITFEDFPNPYELTNPDLKYNTVNLSDNEILYNDIENMVVTFDSVKKSLFKQSGSSNVD